MGKNFDAWNARKQKIEYRKAGAGLFAQEGWVWICTVGVNVGSEQDGEEYTFKRPMLLIKKFNNNIYWAVPLSTKQKPIDFYYNFVDPEGNRVSVILAQLRLISFKRLERKIYEMPKPIFSEIRKQLHQLLG